MNKAPSPYVHDLRHRSYILDFHGAGNHAMQVTLLLELISRLVSALVATGDASSRAPNNRIAIPVPPRKFDISCGAH